jgi:monoamine oxidase
LSSPNSSDLSVFRVPAVAAAAVTNISQNAQGVTVTLASGETLRAPFALVTLPLGVLKESSVGFEPPLPAAKQAAVNDMVRGQAATLFNILLCFCELVTKCLPI